MQENFAHSKLKFMQRTRRLFLMNRLQIVQKYMTISMKISDKKKYEKAQVLSAKIIKIQDKKIADKYTV